MISTGRPENVADITHKVYNVYPPNKEGDNNVAVRRRLITTW